MQRYLKMPLFRKQLRVAGKSYLEELRLDPCLTAHVLAGSLGRFCNLTQAPYLRLQEGALGGPQSEFFL